MFSRHSLWAFSRKLAFIAALTATLAGQAHSASYYVATPIPGKSMAPPAEVIRIRLAAAQLPEATIGKAYAASLATYLSVTGDPEYTGEGVHWQGGTLPAGLSFDSIKGEISGTPTVKNEQGTPFAVTAQYKDHLATENYLVVVGGVVLRANTISMGSTHSCAVTVDGAAVCWGLAFNGEMGTGVAGFVQATRPVRVVGLASGVTQIQAGAGYSCALHNGAVVCWGSVAGTVPSPIAGLESGVTQLTVVEATACALRAGALYCWGLSEFGIVGGGLDVSVAQPTLVSVPAPVRSFTLGVENACVILTTGSVMCWGDNKHGQIPSDASSNVFSPRAIPGAYGATQTVAAYYSICALLGSDVKCWGANGSGQLGRGVQSSNGTIDRVPSLPPVSKLVWLTDAYCAQSSSGAVSCWGPMGAIGTPRFGAPATSGFTFSSSPIAVPALHGASSISASTKSICFVSNSKAYCYGTNANSSHGNGGSRSSVVPVEVLPPN